MVSVGLFDTTDDIQTLVNPLLETELPAPPQHCVLEDAMCFYKHADFEPKLRLRVT